MVYLFGKEIRQWFIDVANFLTSLYLYRSFWFFPFSKKIYESPFLVMIFMTTVTFGIEFIVIFDLVKWNILHGNEITMECCLEDPGKATFTKRFDQIWFEIPFSVHDQFQQNDFLVMKVPVGSISVKPVVATSTKVWRTPEPTWQILSVDCLDLLKEETPVSIEIINRNIVGHSSR